MLFPIIAQIFGNLMAINDFIHTKFYFASAKQWISNSIIQLLYMIKGFPLLVIFKIFYELLPIDVIIY